MNHFKVIIIGAGPAGIAAAARLLENNFKEIIVLEAQNRIGGRVHTSEIDGNVVDLGAEFIHGEKGNVVFELASEFNLANTKENSGKMFSETNFYDIDSKQVNKDLSRQLIGLYEKIIYAGHSEVKGLKASLGEYFTDEFIEGVEELRKEYTISESLVKNFLEVIERWENCIDASDSWFETSLPGNFEYWECDGNLVTIWEGDGYRTIFDLLDVSSRSLRIPRTYSRSLNTFHSRLRNPDIFSIPAKRKSPYGTKPLNIMSKVKLNKKVKKILWNKTSDKGIRNVSLECEDGSKFTCDHVVSTFSLGVLKEKAEEIFSPSLSPRKLNAIKGLGFGTVDKLFLKFPYPWWTDDDCGFAFVWSEEDRKNDSSGWISDVVAFHPVRRGSSILRGWIVGEPARRFETIPEHEVLEGCMELLKKFMGFKYEIPRADTVVRTRWYTNPNFRGSYSCRLIESDVRDVWASDLAEPECDDCGKPLLLFAGEATHNHYFSTVHGAIESGRREADRLLKNVLNGNQLKDRYEVVIVGAGISGLAAAKTLYEEGVTDVIVLEAQETPGGRVKSVRVGDDWLELGAQWIHGEKNEMFELCKKNDLVTDKYSEEGQGSYLRENGTIIDKSLVSEIDDFIKTTLENCEEYVSSGKRIRVPSSIGEELTVEFNKYLNRCNDPEDVKDAKRDLFYWHIRFQLIDNSCDDLNKLSAKAWGLYRFCGGNDYVNFRNGYKSLVDTLIRDIPDCKIMCSTPVDFINWNENVKSESSINGAVGSRVIKVKNCANVMCNNNKLSIDTNYVIVTSSLGYLKNNHKKIFRPSLPESFAEAINSLGYGVLAKIFLIYEKPWWDSSVKGFQIVWSHKRISDVNSRHWGVGLTGFDVIIEKKPILLGWVSGEGARIVENMSESDIGKEATEILRRFTGNENIPLPERVVKSEWFNNEYVLGGYSHITVDFDKNGIDGSRLSRPIYTNVSVNNTVLKKPTILFAGEAVHQTHYSTVHGAYESGISQARVIVKDIRSRFR